MIKKVLKVFTSLLLVFSIGISTMTSTFAAGTNRDDISTEAKNMISKVINFYGGEYKPDVFKHLEVLKDEDLGYMNYGNRLLIIGIG